MKTIRKAADRGHFDHGWLKTFHTFSFSEYQDPNHRHFRALRVMNEDWVAPGQGFGMHPHRDMEIVTYVLSGELEHKDSMGNGEVLRPGEFQRMTAGTGILHSEFNPSATSSVHLYQIWLFPKTKNLTPSYEQKAFPTAQRQDQWRIVASPTGEDGALTIQQDARIYLALLASGKSLSHSLQPGRAAWLQVLRGEVTVGEISLSAGDGLAIEDESQLSVQATADSEIMLFDLA